MCVCLRSLDLLVCIVTNQVRNYVEGGIAQALDAWKQITRDKQVLAFVKGAKLNFNSLPMQPTVPKELKFSV